MSAGLDRRTGRAIAGFAHLQQSIEVIFSTRIGERVLARAFGSNVPAVLGRNLVPSTLLRLYAVIIAAIDAWEPRLRVRRIVHPAEQNGPEQFRSGKLGLVIVADYRPRALEGDLTVENTVTLSI